MFLFHRYRSSFNCKVGIQWNNLILASKSTTEAGADIRDHCALLMDEMIITNGIVYSVSQQKVFGLAELPRHAIKNEIYQNFYGMDTETPGKDNVSDYSYFNDTSNKLIGHTATGLTQVNYTIYLVKPRHHNSHISFSSFTCLLGSISDFSWQTIGLLCLPVLHHDNVCYGHPFGYTRCYRIIRFFSFQSRFRHR